MDTCNITFYELQIWAKLKFSTLLIFSSKQSDFSDMVQLQIELPTPSNIKLFYQINKIISNKLYIINKFYLFGDFAKVSVLWQSALKLYKNQGI